MRLKTILISVLLSGTLLTPGNVNADNCIKKTNVPGNTKPRDTGNIIEYSVSNGILAFLPSPFYNTLCVTVESEETGEMWCGVVTSDNLSMSFTGESGTYTLTCITEDGTEYTSTFIQ